MADEFSVIEEYFGSPARQRTASADQVLLGIGDDAAVINANSRLNWAITTDTLNVGVHFSEQAEPYSVGWKALAVSLSDLAAMSAKPGWFTLSLSLPDVNRAWLAEFSRGLFAIADQFGIALVGGDTTSGPLSISITAAGMVNNSGLGRSSATAGDLIAVTGTLGDAALALRQDGAALPCLAERLHRPTPRVAAALALADLANAAIDVSDGLAADVAHIATASGLGAEINEVAIPRSTAFRLWELAQNGSAVQSSVPIALKLLLGGGDDYELCFTFPENRLSQVKSALARTNCGGFSVIGKMVPETGVRLLRDNESVVALEGLGWNHFSS